jgi:hypothetical protein
MLVLLYTMWSYTIGWLELHGSSRRTSNEKQWVHGVAQGTCSYKWTYYSYEAGLSFEHDDHFEFDYVRAKSTLCGCDCILLGHTWLGESNGIIRHVEIETKSTASVELLKGHIRTMQRITYIKFASRSNMRIILSSTIFEPSLWLWLYTTWSCMIVWLAWYGSSCW